MKYSELKRYLRKNRNHFDDEGAGHEQWKSEITGKTYSVSRHDQEEVPKGTLNRILKDAGLK